ncbi:CoA pyrophosphatase [Halobacillus yeomjeoni]|uniref:NUDIX hydrolase n=1 Tax=Halobacillus yeomjeoni TaxID=311194 RepID=UPI001CD66D06|nr:CoA pyrophosphatase [Halobacillus yeomjeoni]MCA0984830.1 CoA pyrophosphatase [Halobacillus yeomjeoni]
MNFESILEKMKQHSPSVLGKNSVSEYSILLPLIQKEGELHLVFEVRSHKMRRQPGEICFPGGKVDAEDDMEQDAAVREATEELGVGAEHITHVYPFDYLVSPFRMMVHTYVGFMNCEVTDMNPNPDEVEEVFTVPLAFFLENEPKVHHVHFEVKPDEDFPYHLIPGGENYKWQTRPVEELFYFYEDKVIWGLTAKVLNHFIDMIR